MAIHQRIDGGPSGGRGDGWGVPGAMRVGELAGVGGKIQGRREDGGHVADLRGTFRFQSVQEMAGVRRFCREVWDTT